jgi:hypothetical protein
VTTTLTPPADAPTRPDLDALEQLVREWAGVFDFGTDDDDVDILTFKSRACIEDRCDHLGPCDANVAEFAMAHESIATMLNALPALVAEVRRLEGLLLMTRVDRDAAVQRAADIERVTVAGIVAYLRTMASGFRLGGDVRRGVEYITREIESGAWRGKGAP